MKDENDPKSTPLEMKVSLSPDEIYSTIHILSYSKEIFTKMAIEVFNEKGESKEQTTYLARAKISEILCDKFMAAYSMATDGSKMLH